MQSRICMCRRLLKNGQFPGLKFGHFSPKWYPIKNVLKIIENFVQNWFCMGKTKSGSCALIIKIPIWQLNSSFFLKGAPKNYIIFCTHCILYSWIECTTLTGWPQSLSFHLPTQVELNQTRILQKSDR